MTAKAVATVEHAEPSTPMELLSQAVANGNIELAERLMGLQERWEANEARKAFNAAFVALQKQLKPIEKRGRIDIGRGKPQAYALWEDINEEIRPLLAHHGFALNFRVGNTGEKISVVAVLSHVAGYSIESNPWISAADTSGSKNPVQGMGSATSYGKRYTGGPLLNLTYVGEDDDAAAAGGAITEAQLQELIDLADQNEVDKAKFCEWAGVASFADIPARDFGKARTAIMAKGKKQKATA